MNCLLIITLYLATYASDEAIHSDVTPPVWQTPQPLPSDELELSNDNGYITVAYVFAGGTGSRMACKYEKPAGSPWYLTGIKYYTKQGWPNATYEGFGVACWQFVGGQPGSIIWPAAGSFMYNPNTGGNWIRQNVVPAFNMANCSSSYFLVGIAQLYDYPVCDSFGYDNTTPDEQDWANPAGTGWGQAPFGKGTARAILTQGTVGIDTPTLGIIRTLYR
jgi:hypothetical protein